MPELNVQNDKWLVLTKPHAMPVGMWSLFWLKSKSVNFWAWVREYTSHYSMKLITLIVMLYQNLQIQSQSKFAFNCKIYEKKSSHICKSRYPSGNVPRQWIFFEKYLHWKKRSFWPRRHFFWIEYLSSNVCVSSKRPWNIFSFIR